MSNREVDCKMSKAINGAMLKYQEQLAIKRNILREHYGEEMCDYLAEIYKIVLEDKS